MSSQGVDSAAGRQVRTEPRESRSAIVVDSLANHPDLVSQVVDIAWSEWGGGLTQEDYRRWLREADDDCRSNSKFSAGFIAISANLPVGTVQLHEFDLDEAQDRSPWVCGMVVTLEYRGLGVGRRCCKRWKPSPTPGAWSGFGSSPNQLPHSMSDAVGPRMRLQPNVANQGPS